MAHARERRGPQDPGYDGWRSGAVHANAGSMPAHPAVGRTVRGRQAWAGRLKPAPTSIGWDIHACQLWDRGRVVDAAAGRLKPAPTSIPWEIPFVPVAASPARVFWRTPRPGEERSRSVSVRGPAKAGPHVYRVGHSCV